MATADHVLSSVHVGANTSANIGESTVVSEFWYDIPVLDCNVHNEVTTVDEDGDLDPPRVKHDTTSHVIYIEHRMSTPLESVGTQLWSGSLLLADFILHYNKWFVDGIILELGSGLGLIGIVTSNLAHHTFCTDSGESILKLCHSNIVRNCTCLETERGSEILNISVRELDWTNPVIDVSRKQKFAWSKHDLDLLRKTSFVLAADVIYDDHLTNAFFNTLSYLYSFVFEVTPIVYLAMEKRINFTLDDLAPASPAHSYFCSGINQNYKNPETGTVIRINGTKEPIRFPQYFNYDRIKELELWKLEVTVVEVGVVTIN